MKIAERKSRVRSQAGQRMKALSDEWIRRESRVIQRLVCESGEYRQAETIFCYVSFGKEVGTLPIIEDALKAGKKVGVPLCLKKGIMEVRQIKSPEDLQTGTYGILEPKPSAPLIAKDEIEYALIPCVTCDCSGRRMGHGAGYYDRYLQDAGFVKAILCFDEVMVEEVPVDEYDIPMDLVISQKGIKKIKRSS